jgi:hypothetical protein
MERTIGPSRLCGGEPLIVPGGRRGLEGGYACVRGAVVPREHTSYVATAQVPYGWEIVRIILGNTRKIPFSTGTYRAITADLTVPVGKVYRPCGEKIAYRSGSYTVPVGNDYRSRREGLPYRWGRITVPAGKFVRGFSCKSRRNSRDLALRLSVLMH